MKIFAYIYLIMFFSTALFFIIAGLVEKNIPEDKPFKKWWRKHIIGIAPNDVDI